MSDDTEDKPASDTPATDKRAPRPPRTSNRSLAQKSGITLSSRKVRTDMASMLRDKIHEENITKYILMMLQGKNPVFVEDPNGPGGQSIVDKGGPSPTPERRDNYFKLMLERRDGLPAQRIHLEAEVRAAQANRSLGANTLDAVAALDVGTLRQLRLLLSPKPEVVVAAVSEPGAPGEVVDAIDAEFTETVSDPGCAMETDPKAG